MKQAAFAILQSETHFLMILRRGGDLGFPGGKLEEGESILKGMIREVKEEIGLELVQRTDMEVISVDSTKKCECHAVLIPELKQWILDKAVTASYTASHSKEVDGVLLLKKKPNVIDNIIQCHSLAPTVKEELLAFKAILEKTNGH